MESKFVQREKLVFEWIGRILLFLLGVVFIVLSEKFTTTPLFGLVFYESLGVAICGLDVLFTVACVLRAYNWCELKKNSSLQYVGFRPLHKLDLQ